MEMEYHLRHSALPYPGDHSQLMHVVQRLHAGVLDRQRPGWFCHIIEGLEGNRWAMYTKIHHAYIDGMSGVKRMYGSLSPDPEDRGARAPWGKLPERKSRGGKAGGSRSGGLSRQLTAVAELNRQLLKLARELRSPEQRSGSVPFLAPRTHINDPVPSDLRSLGVASISLSELRRAAEAEQCTVNDVVLALSDGALQQYLAGRGERQYMPLVAMCPMSLREPGDDTANTQVATLLVELGQPGEDLPSRLRCIADNSRRCKAEARGMSKEALIDFVLLLGGTFEIMQRTGLDQYLPQSYNVLVSNVPGPEGPELYLHGSRLLAAHPISTLTPGNNLNLTVLSHGTQVDFGLLAAQGTLPDMEQLMAQLEGQFEELRKAYPAPAARRKPRPRKAAAKRAAKPSQRAPKAKKTTRARAKTRKGN